MHVDLGGIGVREGKTPAKPPGDQHVHSLLASASEAHPSGTNLNFHIGCAATILIIPHQRSDAETSARCVQYHTCMEHGRFRV